MYAISYLELNICCLIIMMLILHKQVRGLDKRLTSQTFTELIVSAMVYIFFGYDIWAAAECSDSFAGYSE